MSDNDTRDSLAAHSEMPFDGVADPRSEPRQGVIDALNQIEQATRHISGNAGRLGQIARDALDHDTAGALNQLLYGVDGEEWPRWLSHLPWDVREVYKRILLEARKDHAHAS